MIREVRLSEKSKEKERDERRFSTTVSMGNGDVTVASRVSRILLYFLFSRSRSISMSMLAKHTHSLQ
jgi:hypothetical protein